MEQNTVPQNFSDWSVRINLEQTFSLIDRVLPFEACLYHQVLPLSVEGSRINVGMVNLEDTTALDYVRRMLSYINCSIVPRQISLDAHHQTLSAYLNHQTQQKQAVAQVKEATNQNQRPPKRTPDLDITPPPTPTPPDQGEVNGRETFVLEATSVPPQMNGERRIPELELKSPQLPPEPESHPSLNGAEGRETLVLDHETAVSTGPIPTVNEPGLPVLQVQAQYLNHPIEDLAQLPPPQLLQELLGRVLTGGIGRLFFERQANQGRVLWSQDGILKSVLDDLNPEIFQGLINEFKKLHELPLTAVKAPQQVEIQRAYQQAPLLLRFRVMPGHHGEEATLQVLRGAALKFYQQQQLAALSRDALVMAQQLQRKLNEIRNRAVAEQAVELTPTDVLSSINKLLKAMDQNLQDLAQNPDNPPNP